MAITPEGLREARNSYVVTYVEIVRILEKDEQVFLGVVEGKDAPYYLPRMVAWVAARGHEIVPRLVPASGKANVLAVRRALDENASIAENSVIFIVDKDFGHRGSAARTDTYETPGYSVESYYVSKDAIEKILRYEILEGRTTASIDRVIEEIVAVFCEVETLFCTEVRAFHFWSMAQRISGAKRVSLSPYDRRSFCRVQLGPDEFEVEVKPFCANDLDDEEHHPTDEEVDAATTTEPLALTDIRGKQAALLIIAFLEAATERLRAALSGDDAASVRTVEVGLRSFVGKLSIHADTPADLYDFFDNFWATRAAA